MPPKPKKTKPTLPFAGRLVLGRWMLGLFGAAALPDIADILKDETLEGIDADGVHRFHHELAARFPALPALPVALLRAYDENIVRHTRRLNERRRVRGQAEIVWKHYQYLALLFVEIYLDRYFTDADALRDELNRSIEDFNAGVGDGDRVEPFAPAVPGAVQLNKLAVWCATGAGKTLLMHANILQYQHYLDRKGGHRRLDHTVLLTPNEGLSEQHLEEMKGRRHARRAVPQGQPPPVRRRRGGDHRRPQAEGRIRRQDRGGGRLRGHQPRPRGRGPSRPEDRRDRQLDALPRSAVRGRILVRVLGHVPASGGGQRRVDQPVRALHPVQLLLPLVLRRWVR